MFLSSFRFVFCFVFVGLGGPGGGFGAPGGGFSGSRSSGKPLLLLRLKKPPPGAPKPPPGPPKPGSRQLTQNAVVVLVLVFGCFFFKQLFVCVRDRPKQ